MKITDDFPVVPNDIVYTIANTCFGKDVVEGTVCMIGLAARNEYEHIAFIEVYFDVAALGRQYYTLDEFSKLCYLSEREAIEALNTNSQS